MVDWILRVKLDYRGALEAFEASAVLSYVLLVFVHLHRSSVS